jgi:DNA-3-methyladenine glycosylase
VRALPRRFYARDSRAVAPDLLNKVLVRRDGVGGSARTTRAGRIVEVEAYAGAEDPASHGYRGLTPRTATMFGPPGHLYVYFTYGMHFCANTVCGPEGESSAVLLRALAPVAGLDEMRAARGRTARRDRDLCSGPAKLCQAMGIDRVLDGADLVAGEEVQIVDDGTPPPADPARGVRVGISVAQEHPWRWYVAGDTNLSRPG